MKYLIILTFTLVMFSNCNPRPSNAQDSEKSAPLAEYDAETELDIRASLGEGAIWNHVTNTLWWVDIEGRKLNLYDPSTAMNREIEVVDRIGTVVPSKQGSAIIALESGIFDLDLETGQQVLLCNPLEALDTIRFNDGKCDPAGRLWVGSMSLKFTQGVASLYRINPDGSYEEVFGGVTISNGIVWSHDHKTVYYVDTPLRNVRAWDYDITTGAITNERVAITIPDGLGGPDGMTIDEEGMLWIALWGGNMVGRFNPETGELIAKVNVPAPNVTSCAFGGPDLDVLFITTAGGDNAKMLEEYPLAGSLFKAYPGVKGVKADFFGE